MSQYTKADYVAARGEVAQMATASPGAGTYKLRCPLCRGGSGGEVSLALTLRENDGGYVWLCHRASCGFLGRSSKAAISDETEPFRPTFAARPYPYETEAVSASTVTEEWEAKLKRAFGEGWKQRASEAGIVVRRDQPGELVFINWDWAGRITGRVSKWIHEDGSRTVRTWRESPAPIYSYYSGEVSRVLWLVEDHLSAARLALVHKRPALCLCGTSLSAAVLQECAPMFRAGRVVIALDPDASEKALEMALRLRRDGYDAWPVLLKEDIKDMRWDDLLRLLTEA